MRDKHRQPEWKVVIVAGLILSLSLLGLQGCAYNQPSPLEQAYGDATRNNIAQQVVNPNAGFETPAVGMGPRVGTNVQEAYEKSFKPEARKQEMKLIQQ